MKKILITGVTGFVGKYLLNELKRTNNEIICLIRNPISLNNKIKLIYGDITDKNLKIPKVDCIVHLAAMKKGNEEEMFKVNLMGTRNLLEKNKNVKQFIYISTIFVNAFKSPYTETKKLGENIVKNSGINYTILRLPHMYEKKSKKFFDSKFFVHSYKKLKELKGVKFERGPADVEEISKKIVNSILNKKYFNKTIVV